MKPDAPAEIRGEWRPVATSAPGVQISERLPHLARQADKFRIVRSVTHTDVEHTTSFSTMLTGTYHPRPGVVQPAALPTDAPHIGSVLATQRGWRRGVPPLVSLPALFQPPGNGVWPGQKGGFLGRRFDPLVVQGDKATAHFAPLDLEPPIDVSAVRLEDRKSLLDRLDAFERSADRSSRLMESDACFQQAFLMATSKGVRAALDLGSEPPATRDRYGRHLFGQGLLLARRLSEAGVSLTSVCWVDPTPPGPGGGEFDSHGRIYTHMNDRLLPPTDQALAALIADLHERGLASETLVVVLAEFGRSPRINKDAGRDHWPWAQSILLAGAGIAGGTVFGATDRRGAYPVADPVTPPDLAQSLFHLLGVPAELELRDSLGRPIRACQGTVLERLLS
jgi:hypothetical protein